jgi:uncharacterized protein
MTDNPPNIKGNQNLISVLIVLGIVFVVTMLVTVIKDRNNNPSQYKTDANGLVTNGISVTGKAEKKLKADTVNITFSAMFESEDTNKAKEEVAKRINSAREIILQNGVIKDNITSQNISVSPKYNYYNNANSSSSAGYSANQSISVKFDDIINNNKRITDTIDQIAGLSNISYYINNYDFAKRNEIVEQLRVDAIDKAKKQAGDIAKAAGVVIDKVVAIKDIDNGFDRPILAFARETTSSTQNIDTKIILDPQDVTINYSVNVVYGIK